MSADTAAGQTLDMVVFQAGNHRCAVEAAQIRGSRALMEQMDNADAIATVESLLQLPKVAQTACEQVLLIKHAPHDVPLRISAPAQLQALPATAIHPLPPLLAARTGIAGLRALALMETGAVLLVDIRSLLA